VEAYTIRTDVYNGPLELLLSLIEKRKLLINDISLAEVADDYLKYLERHQDFPLAETAQFVLVGSTLLLIKSKSLLPVLSLTQEEQDSIEDLERRLKLLDKYKTIGRTLAELYKTKRLFTRRTVRRREPEFSPDEHITTNSINTAIRDVLAHLPKGKPKLAETTVKKVVSLEDMMEQLSERINQSMQISFRQFASDAPEGRLNVIVSFLAMLELVRQGVIRVEQEAAHGDIRMEQNAVGVPRYG
jgi:segregation and condensation protein A